MRMEESPPMVYVPKGIFWGIIVFCEFLSIGTQRLPVLMWKTRVRWEDVLRFNETNDT